MAGRIDLWVAGSKVGPWIAAQEGQPGTLNNVLELEGIGGDFWLACNPGTATDELAKLDSAVREIVTDPVREKIERRYR
ncbi:hypothetical protein ACFSM5_03495 [Lacibacterium aquatile]|uniref:Uncharacterized protein n=1 Tax=Lacibacterium aquatile TaxID=1168082 RepID=A0ABW5DLG2_9PROT